MESPIHFTTKINYIKALASGCGIALALCAPSAWLSRLSFGGTQNWTAIVAGSVVMWIVFMAAHLPAAIAWLRIGRRRRRPAFIAFILLPAIVGAGVAAVFSRQSLFPLLVLLALAADDIYTAAVALGLPGGGRFAEVITVDGERWIEASYGQGKDFYYEPHVL
jgi:hypothetical protein